VVLVGYRRTEQRKDAVASGLHDITAIAVDGIDHQVERGIDDRTRLFRVEVLHQLHRALDVSEKRGDRFAFAIERFRSSLGYSDCRVDDLGRFRADWRR